MTAMTGNCAPRRLRVAILSTPTKHHTYFINRLAECCDIVTVIYERRRLKKSYETGPFFAEEEDRFEDRFFDPHYDGTPPNLSPDVLDKVVEFESVNDPDAIEHLKNMQPDLAVSYGIGRADVCVFDIPTFGTINVHRGLAQYYRGLDSDLWAIFDQRFDRIGVTIHYVDTGLDTGHILVQERVPVQPEDEIYHLRYKTSVTATRLVEQLIVRFGERMGRLGGRPQVEQGPYFSAMSLKDKHIALERFEIHQKRQREQIK